MNLLLKIKVIEMFIKRVNHIIRGTLSFLKGYLGKMHQFAIANKVYTHTLYELFLVLLTGFCVSIALIPILGNWYWQYSFSYGLLPWISVQIITYLIREVRRAL